MNKQYYLKNSYGYYFVLGSGFTATGKCGASKLTSAQVTCAGSNGFIGSTEEVAVNKSFAVNYVRPGDLVNGKVSANGNNPSSRRFATFDEAVQHGVNFQQREASKGHLGFYVTESTDPVNAEINWKTRLTNSK
jgi:hypothetical protein